MNKSVFVLAVTLLACGPAWAQMGSARNAAETRQPPTAGASGQDVCTQMQLSEPDLSACRQDWMNAKTDADRLKVRDRYANRHEAPAASGSTVKEPNNSGPCDTLGLKAPDLTQCRAQWKSAQGDKARADVIARYKGVAAGNTTQSRIDPNAPK